MLSWKKELLPMLFGDKAYDIIKIGKGKSSGYYAIIREIQYPSLLRRILREKSSYKEFTAISSLGQCWYNENGSRLIYQLESILRDKVHVSNLRKEIFGQIYE